MVSHIFGRLLRAWEYWCNAAHKGPRWRVGSPATPSVALRIVLPAIVLAICAGACAVDPPENREARLGEVADRTDARRTGSGAPGRTAFTNVNVIPMHEEGVFEDQTVLIEDGRIARIGPSNQVEIPAGTRVIDGQGHYLMPGLIDFHIHLRSTDELISYLARGVTTVVHLSGAMSGAPDLLRYREALSDGDMIGPTLLLAGTILDGDPAIFPAVSRVIRSPEEGKRAVAEQHERGFDFIKVYNNLAPEALESVVQEAHARGMPVIGHIPRNPNRSEALQRALEAGLDIIAHSEEYFFTYFYAGVDSALNRGEEPVFTDQQIEEAVRLTREAGAVVIPNLSFVAMTRRQLDDFGAVMRDPESHYLDPDVREMWEEQNPTNRQDLQRFDLRERAKYRFVQRLTKALNDAGVMLLAGTDASAPGMFPGSSMHLELSELVNAGLTPYDAIATATFNPGRFLATHDRTEWPTGAVAPGNRADLLLVASNPLEEIGHVSSIEGVMVRGRWYSGAELDAFRAEIAASYTR